MTDLERWVQHLEQRRALKALGAQRAKRFIQAPNRYAEDLVIDEVRMEAHRRSPYRTVQK